jgi:dTMP kinase
MKFIVIEGLDGAGKSTQINLLKKFFTTQKTKFKCLHFPRTDSPVFGELIARFLRGEFGNINSVNPYLVALIYAGDRKDASTLIKKWLEDNYFVIADRYVYSNIAFQCAKIKDTDEKNQLNEWIKNLEYNYYKIPQPDLSIFLDVPLTFTAEKLFKKRSGNDREYLKGKKDIHEINMKFQKQVRNIYLSEVKANKNFISIDCSQKENIIESPGRIFEKIVIKLRDKKIIT